MSGYGVSVLKSDIELGTLIFVQEWPVTPFKIHISISSNRHAKAREFNCPFHIKLYVDGFQAQRRTLKYGGSFISDGIAEFAGDSLNIKEYCFSLPRYAQHKDDRMEDERSDQIGSIRAEFFTTTYVPAPEFMYTGPRTNRRPAPSYVQASKSDVLKATGGSYTACTTMVGDVSKQVQLQHSGMRRTPWFKSHRPDHLVKTLEIRYRMGHDLVAMGLKPAPQAPAPQEPAPQKAPEVAGKKSKSTTRKSKEKTRKTRFSPKEEEKDEKPAEKPMFELEPEEKENQIDLIKSEDDKDALEKKHKHRVLRSLNQNVVSKCESKCTLNMEKFSESFIAASLASPEKSPGGTVTRNLTNIDSKAAIKLESEPAHGIITIDPDDTYDEDALELMESYIMVSDDDELYIVEDLIEPSILEVDESVMDSPANTPGGGAAAAAAAKRMGVPAAVAASRRSSMGLGAFGLPD